MAFYESNMAESWLNPGSIMAQSWLNHGSTMAHSWLNHGSIWPQSYFKRLYLFMLVNLCGNGPRKGYPLCLGSGDPTDIGKFRFSDELQLIWNTLKNFEVEINGEFERVFTMHCSITDRDSSVLKILRKLGIEFVTDTIHVNG